MKKVLMVSPSLQGNVQVNSQENSSSLGLAYLHAVMEKTGYSVETFNYNNVAMEISEKEIEEKLRAMDPDFFLVQVFTMNRVGCRRAIEIARKIKPSIPVIAGGVHASIYYGQVLEHYGADYVVIGEGEHTIIDLLATLSAGASVDAVKGIAFRRGGRVITGPQRDLIPDKGLDELPFPKHGLFIGPNTEMACILTTRGCPFKCSFCCLHTISKRRFRRRSVDSVVDEIAHIADTFKQIKTIQISDDTFTLDQPRAIAICREIIRRGIKMKFLCSARIKPASVELFEVMEQAGFVGIGFGLETGSDKLLHAIHKSITRADVINTFKMLKDRKIAIATYLMVGFPGETEDTVNETIDLIKTLQKIKYFEFAGVARLWVYPNTEVYEVLRAHGRIDDSYWLTDKDVPFFTLEHSEEELERMVTKITLACQPWRQWVKRILLEFLHPVETSKKVLPRLRKLRMALFHK